MKFLLYGALLLAQAGTSAKQYAMKKCGGVAPGPFNSVCINLARAAICFVISLIIWLAADGSGSTVQGALIGIAAGIGTAVSLFAWILSTQCVPLMVIESGTTIGMLVLPMFLAPFLYGGESVTLIQWIATALIVVSLFLFAKKDEQKKQKKSVGLAILLVFLSSIGGMIGTVFKKLYTFHIFDRGLGSVEFYTLMSFVAMLATFLILFVFSYRFEYRRVAAQTTEGEKPVVELPYRRVWVFILMAALALYVNELFATYASMLPAAIYYPATKVLSVLCCFLLDVIVFREKVTRKSLVGLVLMLAAVVMINF